MLIDEHQSFLKESIEDLINPEEYQEDFSVQDIKEILDELSQDELNDVGECIIDLIYDPEFDLDDMEESEEISEKKYFGTRKREIDRNKKKNIAKRKLDKKARKRYYKKNRAKLKRKNKLYRKKVKRQPNIVRKHRK